MNNPSSVQQQLNEAARLIKSGEREQARQMLRELARGNPQNPDVWFLASYVAANPEQQRSFLERALKLKPDHTRAQAQLARLKSGTPPPVSRPVAPLSPSEQAKAKPAKSQSRGPDLLLIGLASVAVVIVVLVVILLFTPKSTPTANITIVTLDKKATLPLVSKQTLTTSATKLAPNEKIMFVVESTIYLANPDGTGIVPLYLSPNGYFSGINGRGFGLSPDGRYLTSVNRGWGSPFQIFSMDSGGAYQHKLGDSMSLAWSPDSKQIAIGGKTNPNTTQKPGIFLVNPDGSNPHPLTAGNATENFPSYSPDGKRIAFARSESQQMVYMVDSDGANETRLAVGTMPAWSPDGRYILFNRDKALFSISVDGKLEKRLYGLSNWSAEASYVWSPDSRSIGLLDHGVFSVLTVEGLTVWMSDAKLDIQSFVWSPDSKRLLMYADNKLTIAEADGSAMYPLLSSPIPHNPAFANGTRPPDTATLLDLTVHHLHSVFAWLTSEQVVGMQERLAASAENAARYSLSAPYYFAMVGLSDQISKFDGSQIYRLSRDDTRTIKALDIAPDGQRVAYAQETSDYKGMLYVMDSNGANTRELTAGDLPRWSTDGKRISYLSYEDHHKIYVIDAAGGTPVRVSSQEPMALEWAWSPDSSQIAYVAGQTGELVVVNADGSNEHTIAPESYAPDWSPDGKQIAHSCSQPDGNTKVCIVPANGATAPRQIADGSDPAWSPDGTQIVFQHDYELYVMKADGSDVRRLTDTLANEFGPAWSPDGRWIAYWVRMPDTGGYDLGFMHADGSNPRSAPFGNGWLGNSIPLRPKWLPGVESGGGFSLLDLSAPVATVMLTVPPPGQSAAVRTVPARAALAQATPTPTVTLTRTPSGGGTGRALTLRISDSEDVAVALLSGDKLASLSETSLKGPYTQIAFAPDGWRVVLTKHSGPNEPKSSVIVVAGLVNSPEHQVTQGPNDSDPAWSPDGKQIVYSGQVGAFWQIQAVNDDGTNLRQITHITLTSDTTRAVEPAWSPDGQQIAYVLRDTEKMTSEIHLMSPDGSNDRKLIENGSEPAWSPDSQQIAYVLAGKDSSDIYIANADGSKPHPITKGVGYNNGPAWSPDNQLILFKSDNTIRVIRTDGSRVVYPWGDGIDLIAQNVYQVHYARPSWQPASAPDVPMLAPTPTIALRATRTPLPTSTPYRTVPPASRTAGYVGTVSNIKTMNAEIERQMTLTRIAKSRTPAFTATPKP